MAELKTYVVSKMASTQANLLVVRPFWISAWKGWGTHRNPGSFGHFSSLIFSFSQNGRLLVVDLLGTF